LRRLLDALAAVAGLGRTEIEPGRWRALCASSPLLSSYGTGERERLRVLAGGFLGAKSIEAAGGAAVDDDVRLAVAAQGAVPVLGLGLDWYAGWRSVVIYPGDFVARQQFVDEDGVSHDLERELSGEAWDRGPVVLSLEGVLEGLHGEVWGNLVVHELAHKLDLLNGIANGMPPLHASMSRSEWTRHFSAAYEDQCARLARRRRAPLDEHAGDDPAEFFACASEAFFVEPWVLREAWPEVQELLAAFYRQRPEGLE